MFQGEARGPKIKSFVTRESSKEKGGYDDITTSLFQSKGSRHFGSRLLACQADIKGWQNIDCQVHVRCLLKEVWFVPIGLIH